MFLKLCFYVVFQSVHCLYSWEEGAREITFAFKASF